MRPPPAIIDSHAHLDDERFAGDLADVIERAHSAGVGGILTVGTGFDSCARALEIASRHRLVKAAVGIHPHDAAQAPADWRERLKAIAGDERVVAIGETGLDFHYMHSPAKDQERLFAAHLALARELEMPVVVHSREAEERTIEMLSAEARLRGGELSGVMHCFSGGLEAMTRAVGLGMHVSFAGPVTFRKAEDLRSAAKTAPLDRILVETDCPYLSPEPFRGKRNEPARVEVTARCIAGLRGMRYEEFARATVESSRELLGLG